MSLVLLYHRIADDPADPLHMSIAPQAFAAHITSLQSRFDIVPLEQLLLEERADQVAITLDDGYADLYHNAIEILVKYAVPATIFPIVGNIASGEPFWWERLRESTGQSSSLSTWNKIKFRRTFRRLRSLPSWEAAQTFEVSGTSNETLHRSMTRDELRRLAEIPLLTFGSHTMWHSRLSCLDAPAQRTEICDSKALLESILERPVTYFAYPYGDKRSFDLTTLDLVSECGYEYAFVNYVSDLKSDAWRIPRLSVPDCPADQLLKLIDRRSPSRSL